jgi:membrane fusion protein (multidrug efflux system)
VETSFSRTLRSLRAERSRLVVVAPLVAVLLLGFWAVWFAAAPVRLWVVTRSARLEVETSTRRVGALSSGRLSALHVVLGARVRAGDVLAELDPEEARLVLEEARASVPALERQREALDHEIAAERERAAMLERAGSAELEELAAGIRGARSSAESARDEAERFERLHTMGLIADSQAVRSGKQADGEESQIEVLAYQRERRGVELKERLEEARGRLQRLDKDRAEVDGDLASALAAVDRLDHALDELLVRAPVDGIVGALAERRPGDIVQACEELVAIVPDGRLRVMAEFPVAETAGRVAVGQSARMRLDGFPWLQRGALSARVTAVATEARGDRLQVELELVDALACPVPLRHGMTGSVEVAVERVSPLDLVLRSVGRLLSHAPETAP